MGEVLRFAGRFDQEARTVSADDAMHEINYDGVQAMAAITALKAYLDFQDSVVGQRASETLDRIMEYILQESPSQLA